MMRLLLMILFIPSIVYCQNKYTPIRDYLDQKTIEDIKAKNKSASCKFLVYQPSSDTGKASSILIIKTIDATNYWIIKNDSVLESGKLNSSRIFFYKDYLKTGTIKKEDKLKFVPPLMSGEQTENVIYEDSKQKFYFEYGKNVTGYSPDIELEKYRKEWIELIREDLKSILNNY